MDYLQKTYGLFPPGELYNKTKYAEYNKDNICAFAFVCITYLIFLYASFYWSAIVAILLLMAVFNTVGPNGDPYFSHEFLYSYSLMFSLSLLVCAIVAYFTGTITLIISGVSIGLAVMWAGTENVLGQIRGKRKMGILQAISAYFAAFFVPILAVYFIMAMFAFWNPGVVVSYGYMTGVANLSHGDLSLSGYLNQFWSMGLIVEVALLALGGVIFSIMKPGGHHLPGSSIRQAHPV